MGTKLSSRRFFDSGLIGTLRRLSPERSNARTVTALVGVVVCGAAFFTAVLFLRAPKIAITAYVLGLGIIATLFEPFYGLLNYILFVYVRPQEFIEIFRGLPLMIIVGGATFVITLLYYAFQRRWILQSRQDLVVIWFYTATIMSQLANFYIGGATDTAQFFASRVVVYLLMASLVVTIPKLSTVLYLLVVLTLFQAAQGILQYFTGTGFAGQEMVQDDRIRGIGIFADPNNLAMTFLMMVPFVVLKTIASRSLLFKVTGIAIVGVLIYGVILTDSRGGFLGLGVVTMIMFSRKYGYKRGIVVGVLLFALLFAAGSSRMQNFDTRESSAYGRVLAWAAGMDMFQSNPLFGVGAKNFTDYHILAAHNSFIQCAAELGFFGFFPWILLVVVSFRTTHYVSRHAESSDLRLQADAVFNGMVAFLACAMFIARAYNDLFFILVGLSTAVGNLYIQSAKVRIRVIDRSDLIITLFVSVGLLVLFKAYVVSYW